MAKYDKWTTVMVKKTTREQLQRVQALFESQALKGQLPDCPRHDRFGISVDTVIQILIARDDAHRKRGARNSRPRKAKADESSAAGSEPGVMRLNDGTVVIL